MRKVFISYAREDKPDVDQLVEHLRVLGCDTWSDNWLHGGQDWWEEILQRIADCDTFIPIISREALTSTACEREFDWSEALGKPVLPVAVEPPPTDLPGRVSRRQIVDYSDRESRDRAALMLAGGLATLPPAPPLPDPLPEPPRAPLPYLTDLLDLVSQPEALNNDQQRDILNRLNPALRSPDQEERRGGRRILNSLSDRRDLNPSVARTITYLIRGRASDIDSGKPIDWDDLLGHIQQQMLVPVVGPDLTVVKLNNTEQTFDTMIGQRLAERYDLPVSPLLTTMGEAVVAILGMHGRDELERLYRVINNIMMELDPAPGYALRDLAAIDALHLFVTTTPDRLLAKAINEVRFQGREMTREITFSPASPSTIGQSRNSQPAAPTETVVLSLFGQAASTPQYAIHEEDKLEWLYALLTVSLPDWLAYQLKANPMLFIGCDFSDSMWPFLLRMSSNTRLFDERKQFFFVGSSGSHVPSSFSTTYLREARVQQLQMEPTAFVAELRARWEQQSTRPG